MYLNVQCSNNLNSNRKCEILLVVLLFFVMFFSSVGCSNRPPVDETQRDVRKVPEKTKSPEGRRVFERNLKKLVKEGHYVLVDKNESDILISEDIYSRDYGILEELAKIKSENLGIPLFTENIGTLGGNSFIEKVHPTDRKAYQDFLITETQLMDPSYFSKKYYLNSDYNRAEAMDKKRTVKEMIAFIGRYPESRMTHRAISYIEYQMCLVKKDPDGAIKIYKRISDKYKDAPGIQKSLEEYEKRAVRYKKG
ncbi:MAG: hypothetical protein K8T10_17450 [Candidatus Eremiobacteraeota bacterium]|nr:hypothetical protein [Candidatus Eremiobacteraeota bacterium]